MAKILTSEEQGRAELFRMQIARKSEAYVILMNNADTKRYAQYMDTVEKMIMTGKYSAESIADAVAKESLYLERFASIDRAYNEINALVHAYNNVFPELPLKGPVQDALEQMKNTHRLGLSAIINILENRTVELLEEIKKQKPDSNNSNSNTP